MSTHRYFLCGYRALGAVNTVRKRAQEQALRRRAKYQNQEEKAIERDIKSNTTMNDNRRNEADSAVDKEFKNTPATQPDVRKPCAIKLPIGFFDNDKVRILYGQKNGANVILLYIVLVDFAAKSNRNGALYVADGIPYDTEVIANLTRMDTAVVKNALESLQRFGLIRVDNDAIFVTGYAQLVEYEQPKRRHR